MARTFTPTERGYISASHTHHAIKLELTNYNGTWVDMTSWLLHGTLEENIDQDSMILNATLQRDNGSTQSLSPLRTDSTLNVDDAAAYQPFLDPARQWRLSVAVVSFGTTITSGHYKEIGAGVYDLIEISHPSPTIQVYGRDYGAMLIDKWIGDEKTYGDDASPVAMETVIQQVLDDHFGAGAITLYTPTSPSFVMQSFTLKDLNVMDAVNLIAKKAGFVCRYRYDASDVQRLTLFAPNRSATAGSEVYTLTPSEYTNIPIVRLDLSGVRNKLIGRYLDSTTNEVETITVSDTTSITRYGGPRGISRDFYIDLAKDTTVTTSAKMTAFLNAVLSDTKNPSMEQQVEWPGGWPAQVMDYVKLEANGVHYDTAQYGGVTSLKHSFQQGTIKTTLNLRGQPAGRYRTWTADERIQGVPELRIRNFREIARTDTTCTFGWENEGLVNELWLWLDTTAQPIAADPWPALNSEPDVRLTSATVSYEVTLPDFGYVVLGQLVPIDTNGVMGRPWQFTLMSQDAPRLVQRATIQTTTATTVTVRVAVADPQPRNAISIAHVATGCTVDLSSPQAIAAGSVTTSIDTTGTVDYVVTRPAFQAGTGRVTFTASATDRVTDIDAIDIPAQERDTVELLVSGVAQSSTATAMVVRVAVADPATGGSGDVTITWVQVGTGGVAPASGQTIASANVTTSLATTGTVDFTITRSATGAGSGLVTFTASRTGRVAGVLEVAVAPQERNLTTDPVSTAEIEDAAITAAKIGAAAVEEAKIAAGAVTEAKLGAAAVTTAKLANLAVTDAILAANAVTTTKITDTAVTSAKIAANTIVAGNIAAGTITTTEIAANTITAGDIAAGTITGTEIAAATITGAKLVANTITASQIAAGTITATEIAASAITTAKLDALAVTTDKIAANAITAAKIAANTITAAEIAANAITADEISAGAVTAAKISVTSLSAITAALGSVTLSNGTGDDLTFIVGTENAAVVEPFSVSSGVESSQGLTITVAKVGTPATTAALSWFYRDHNTITDGGILRVGGVIEIATQTPASASAAGSAGTIAWDSSYIYVCTAADTWKRVAIATW